MAGEYKDSLVQPSPMADGSPGTVLAESNPDNLAVTQVWADIEHKEIARILEYYIRDTEKTDIQKLLLNPATRDRIIEQVKAISEIAQRSLVSLLTDGVQDKTMERTQADVDALTALMKEKGSRLVEKGDFPGPEDSDYWQAESSFAVARKTGGDARWLAWDKNDPADRARVESVLAEAHEQEAVLGELLASVVDNLPEGVFVSTSQRTKGLDSILSKVNKFRGTSWGKDATVADVFDGLGARIVVDDLATLERVMEALEDRVAKLPGAKILRKENKFIVNDGKADPYRAIQYTIALPSSNGTLQTGELQLKTLPSMIASDLFHNAVYKPEALNLHDELKGAVSRYNWQSDWEEMSVYLGGASSRTKRKELDPAQQVEQSIELLEYNNFYDLVLRQIEAGQPLDPATRDKLKRFHSQEAGKLRSLADTDPKLYQELIAAAHESYFEQTAQDVLSPAKYQSSLQFGDRLPDAAVALLTPAARARYESRYENFTGSNNKLSVDDLGLLDLNDAQLKEFFIAAGKDITAPKVAAFLDKAGIKSQDGNFKVMNLYHAHFSELAAAGERITDPVAREKWQRTIVDNQIGAVVSSSILTEIGGVDETGTERDLSVAAVSSYSKREMLTFLFWIAAVNPGSEFTDKAYADFVTAESSSWARDYDKKMDRDIMKTVVDAQMRIIEESIQQEDDRLLLARWQKARIELLQKYASVMVPNSEASALIRDYYRKEVVEKQVKGLLRGEAKGDVIATAVQQSAKIGNLRRVIESIHAANSEEEIFEELLMTVNDPEYLKHYIFAQLGGDTVQKVQEIVVIAEQAHRDQKRAEGTPYILHPLRIMIRLLRSGEADAKTLSVAALHDVIEDNPTAIVGNEDALDADIIESVTTLSKVRNGEKLSPETYYAGLMSAHERDKRIKVMDRIDNLRSLNLVGNPDRKKRYIEETKTYVVPLAEFDPSLTRQLAAAMDSIKL